MSGFTCGECGLFAADVDEHGQAIRREYNDKDVCVSCLSKLKLENGDYQ